MILLPRITQQISILFFVTLLFLSSGCSTIVEKKTKEFDSSKVNNILFAFDHDSKFMGSNLPTLDISTQVAKNLAEWGYKIKADKSIEYDHVLSIEIGEMQHASTPAGFSFSMGDSDPRAIDFQKADVLLMRCYLTEKGRPENNTGLDATVTADEYLAFKRQNLPRKALTKMLVNDVSTICFNLLNNLKISTLPYKKNIYSTKPGWFPDIRVEVVNDEEPDDLGHSPAVEEIDEIPSNNKDHAPTNENKPIKKPSRKRIIIHNQGSPVIIKFGHERK